MRKRSSQQSMGSMSRIFQLDTHVCAAQREDKKKESKSAIFENITKFLLGAAGISLHADVYDNTFMKHMGG